MSALRIAVCLPQVPFERGGAEILADELVGALRERGHEADLVSIPYRWRPDRALLENSLLWRGLDLGKAAGRPVDVVVGTKFPSYLVRHPCKVVWLFHQYRQVYDLHGTRFAPPSNDPMGTAMLDVVRKIDRRALAEARSVYAISANTARRLRHYNGVDADVILPPPQRTDLAWIADDGYILSVGRLDATKRVDLLIDAMADVPESRAVIVGAGDERQALQSRARKARVSERIEFRGWVDDEELKTLYGRCRAVFYAPHDEDYGMVTVEAHLARKPVITTTDAGGPLEFVRDGVGGVIATPDPASVAEAVRAMTADSELAHRLGDAAYAAAHSLNWDSIVRRLLRSATA